MSFGGSVSAMISSLKNNSRAKRKSYFDNKNNKYSNENEKKSVAYKKATPEQIAEIKNKLMKENKKERLKNIIFVIFALISIIMLLLFLNNLTI